MPFEPKEPTLPPHISQLLGMVRTVTQIPTHTPRSYWDAVLIYLDNPSSPTTKRLYVFSDKAKQWFYVNLT